MTDVCLETVERDRAEHRRFVADWLLLLGGTVLAVLELMVLAAGWLLGLGVAGTLGVMFGVLMLAVFFTVVWSTPRLSEMAAAAPPLFSPWPSKGDADGT